MENVVGVQELALQQHFSHMSYKFAKNWNWRINLLFNVTGLTLLHFGILHMLFGIAHNIFVFEKKLTRLVWKMLLECKTLLSSNIFHRCPINLPKNWNWRINLFFNVTGPTLLHFGILHMLFGTAHNIFVFEKLWLRDSSCKGTITHTSDIVVKRPRKASVGIQSHGIRPLSKKKKKQHSHKLLYEF